jgi:hypothetical protein
MKPCWRRPEDDPDSDQTKSGSRKQQQITAWML